MDIIIGLTSEGVVVTYNYRLNETKETSITRKIYKKKFIYKPNDLYFLDRNYLYVSSYNETTPPAFYFTYFLDAPEPRKWYRIDLETGQKAVIKSPSKFSIIVGTQR
jgi:hypothetical protein